MEIIKSDTVIKNYISWVMELVVYHKDVVDTGDDNNINKELIIIVEQEIVIKFEDPVLGH